MFHRHWRALALASLSDRFDVAVVGAGITGCGIFMDAAQRGLRVLLVERDDVASGTSSRSSKLVHGGLRYLKQMQLGITRSSCRERDRMLGLNPELVRPLRFLYPANEGDRTPGWTVDLGLWMYDRLTRGARRHEHPTLDEVRELAPGLDLERLDRAMVYGDALADDARMTLAVAATGFAYGGRLLTRAEVLEPVRDGGGAVRGLRLEDRESGRLHEVEAALVVNASGVWVDGLRARFGLTERRLRPSRGSHVVLPTARLPLDAAVTIPSPDDGRPVFLIPHPEGILVGTTDVYHDDSLDDPRATRNEVDYLLRAVTRHFPAAGIGPGQVVAAFAGLRPILDSGADDPSEASREEDLWQEDGLLSVAGGKLTTWRPTAEETVDRVLTLLPKERAGRAATCRTGGTPLAGVAGPRLDSDLLAARPELGPVVASALARRLRGGAWRALSLARGRRELQPLLDGVDLTAAEVRTHLTSGAVVRLEDLLVRRARLALWQPEAARAVLPELAPLFTDVLGWSAARWRSEESATLEALEAWSPQGVEA